MQTHLTLNHQGKSRCHRLPLWKRAIGWGACLIVLSVAPALGDPAEKRSENRASSGQNGGPNPAPEQTPARLISLDDACYLALANEEQIKIAGRELAKAQLLPWRAVAVMTPRGDIDGIYTRNKEEIAFTQSGVNIDPNQEVFATSSTIRPLDEWRGIFRAIQPVIEPSFLPSWRLGKNAVRESEQRYDFTIREILFGVAEAYYNVLRFQAQVKVSEETLRLAQDELRQAQARFRVGEVTKTDVLRAEVSVARAERALVVDQNRLQLALAVLARVVGLEEPVEVVEPPPPIRTSGGYEQLLDGAYQHRQDLQALEAAVEVARQRKNLVLARYFPQVDARWEMNRITVETFADRDKFWTLFLNFKVPIFDGGVRELDLQEENENLAQAGLRVAELRKQIRVEVKEALLTVETLTATLETLKKEVTLAEDNYTITSKQYGVGLSTSLDVNTSLNELNQVRTQLIDQTYAYQVALLGLEKAVGTYAQNYLPHR